MSYSLGKYRIVAELGHGGMADVLLAMVDGPSGTRFTKFAAIKRLRRNLVEEEQFITMLVDEARISARLSHPNVVQTLEVGAEADEYFIAMEFLDGQPLHRIQRRADRAGVKLSQSFMCAVLLDVLAGLHHAHELVDYDGTPLSIVHRDVTPQNVFVTYDGQVKIVDFGIAKAAGSASQTQAGIVKGKIRFMSPEQAAGQRIDRRTDIFSVGILLWEAMTGRRFWQAKDDLAISRAVIAGDYQPSPRAIESSVPPEIDAICRKALAYSADDRYQTAAEFRSALEAALDDGVIQVRRELGPTVASLFEKERAALRTIIERAALESRSRQGGPNSLLPSMSPSSITSAVPVAQPESYGPLMATPSRAPTTSLQPSDSSIQVDDRRRRLLSAAFGVTGVALAVAALVFAASGSASGESEAAAQRAPRIVTRSANLFVTSGITRISRGESAAMAVGPAQHAAPAGGGANAPPTKPTSSAAAPAGAPAATTTPHPAPTSEMPTPSTRRARGSLDSTDPW